MPDLTLWGLEPCDGCAEMWVELYADPATGAFGGSPYGATNPVRDAPTRGWNCMWALQLGLSVELPMGPRNL